MKIETNRLFLRELKQEDLDAVYTGLLADPVILKQYPHLFNKENVRELILRNVERYRIFGFGLWAICMKKTGEMIGGCGLVMHKIDGFIRPEMLVYIRRDMQRKGYATEAASAVCGWAFKNTTFHEIYTRLMFLGRDSKNVAKTSAGHFTEMIEHGSNEHKIMYVIKKSEWEKLRKKK
jgi:RimJ/RimL family protein N-acetyltransferase